MTPGQVICGCVDLMADADFLNQYIIYRCQMTAQAREKKGTAFQNSADILKTIKKCTDVDVVTDLRYQIITEMMQIRHIEVPATMTSTSFSTKFGAFFQLHAPCHAPCAPLCLVPMLLGS